MWPLLIQTELIVSCESNWFDFGVTGANDFIMDTMVREFL